jgi:hypothetical protein
VSLSPFEIISSLPKFIHSSDVAFITVRKFLISVLHPKELNSTVPLVRRENEALTALHNPLFL